MSNSPEYPKRGPGKRYVDRGDAINSKAPLDKLVGTIPPSDLHYERSHSGIPEIDPAVHHSPPYRRSAQRESGGHR